MSERRRRRRLHSSQDSELSDDENPLPEKETDGESDMDKTPGGATSEYESAEEVEEPSEDEQTKAEVKKEAEIGQPDKKEYAEPPVKSVPHPDKEDSGLTDEEKEASPKVAEREPEIAKDRDDAQNQNETDCIMNESSKLAKEHANKEENGKEEDEEEEELDYEEEEPEEEEERQEGDGQECAEDELEPDEEGIEGESKSLDDDEDRRNPQYIPKKGAFYEHDDRVCGEFEENKEKEKKEKEPKKKKKLWLESSRWGHDMFIEEEQAPKSREELINSYGYDIRGEDRPPKARRPRRYTGPAKYTRSWEDEKAYVKSGTTRPSRGGQRGRGRGGRGRGGNRRGSINNNITQDILQVHSYNEEEKNDSEEKPPPPKEREDIVIIKKEEFPALPTTAIPPHHLPPSVTAQHSSPPSSPPESSSIESSPKSESSNKENAEEVVVTTLTFENSSLSSKPHKNEQLPPRFREENVKQRGRGNSNSRFGNRGVKTLHPSIAQHSPPMYSNHFQEGQLAKEFRKISLHQPKERKNSVKSDTISRERKPLRDQEDNRHYSYRILPRQNGETPRYPDHPPRKNYPPNNKDMLHTQSPLGPRFTKQNRNGAPQENVIADGAFHLENRPNKSKSHINSERNDTGEKLVHGSLPKVSHQNEPSSRPKRYSSLRPRNVPETYHAPEQTALQPPAYFEATNPGGNFGGGAATLYVSTGEGGGSQPPPPGHSPPPPILATSFAPYQERGAYTLTPATITTAASRIFPPPPPGAPYLAAPPTYAPHPAAAAPPPPPPAGYPQYPFQQFVAPPPPPPTVTQPSEFFIGGITYYNMMTQHLARAPPKREKKSIAIINPSEAVISGEDFPREEYDAPPPYSPEHGVPAKESSDSPDEQPCSELPPSSLSSSTPPTEAPHPSPPPPLVSQGSTVQVES